MVFLLYITSILTYEEPFKRHNKWFEVEFESLMDSLMQAYIHMITTHLMIWEIFSYTCTKQINSSPRSYRTQSYIIQLYMQISLTTGYKIIAVRVSNVFIIASTFCTTYSREAVIAYFTFLYLLLLFHWTNVNELKQCGNVVGI